MKLRPYQDALVNHTTPNLWREGKRRVVWVLPTGAGKTACAEALIARIRRADWAPVYYIAHTSELVTQPGERFRGSVEFAYLRAGVAGDPTCGVQVCSAQTAVRRELRPIPRNDGSAHIRCVVVIDEAHRRRSETYHRIMQDLGDIYQIVYVILMTATPYRLDGRGLADVADVLVEAVTPLDGFRDGWLMDPVIYSRPPPMSDDETMHSPGIIGDIVAEWERRADGRPTIARCVNRAHARDVAERFATRGFRAGHIDGTMSFSARELLLARLAIGGQRSSHPLALDVLCSGGTILEEGFDSAASYRHVLSHPAMWPSSASGTALPSPGSEAVAGLVGHRVDDAPPRYRPLGCLIDAAPSSSRGAWIQRIGRVARTFSEIDVAEWAARGIEADVKETAVVLCHSGNLEMGGFLGQHRGFTLGEDLPGASPMRSTAYPRYRPPLVRQCPACFASALVRSPCPACGSAVGSTNSLPDEHNQDTELRKVVWNPDDPPPDSLEQRVLFLETQWRKWLAARAERAAVGQPPYSVWWPAARYKAKYGRFPDQTLYRAIARNHGVHKL